jgi:hypothetical protein
MFRDQIENILTVPFAILFVIPSISTGQPIQQENHSASDPDRDHVFCHGPGRGGDGF